MATRANIVVKEGNRKLWFYKHNDGYPEGTLPLLEPLMKRLEEGSLRNNLSQFSGWLILAGHDEFVYDGTYQSSGMYAWKCGSIEPTTSKHADIEYLYTIDLDKKSLKVKAV